MGRYTLLKEVMWARSRNLENMSWTTDAWEQKRRNYMNFITTIECMDIFYCVIAVSSQVQQTPDCYVIHHLPWNYVFQLGSAAMFFVGFFWGGAGVFGFGVCVVGFRYFLLLSSLLLLLSFYLVVPCFTSNLWAAPGQVSCHIQLSISHSKWDELQEALGDYLLISSSITFSAIRLNTVHNLEEPFYSNLAVPPDLPCGPSRCVIISSLLNALIGEVRHWVSRGHRIQLSLDTPVSTFQNPKEKIKKKKKTLG